MQSFDTLSYRGQIHRLRRLAHTALEHYAVPVARLVPLRHETNTTFRIVAADHQQYVLRIHRPQGHTVEQIRSELCWLLALRQDTDLHIPEPVLTRDGLPLTGADVPGVAGPRTCVLFRWLPGRFVDERLTPKLMERVGVFTARLHQHAAQWQPPPDFRRSRVDGLTEAARQMEWASPTAASSFSPVHPTHDDVDRTIALITDLCSAEDAAIVAQTIEQIRRVFHELGEGQDVFGLIHADLHQENYFFHRGTPCAIDFDDCGWGHYVFDLNVTLRESRY